MTKRQQAESMLKAINQAITEIAEGATSATLSVGSSSQTYTRADLGTLRDMRRELRLELASYRNKGRPPITMTGVRFV